MMTESEAIRFIGSELCGALIGEAVGKGVDTLSNVIKKADHNRKSEPGNLQTELFRALLDALNQFTYNRYQGTDQLYDATECIVKGFMSRYPSAEAIQSGLKMLVPSVNDDDCSRFLEIFGHEICQEETSVLYKEIDLLWRTRESRYTRGAFEENDRNHEKTHEKLDCVLEKLDQKEEVRAGDYGEIPPENRAQDYADKWNRHVFLNHFDSESENGHDKVNICLRDLYVESLLPHYTWREEDEVRDTLKDKLTDYIGDVDEKRMLLILGQAGIGKSTLITWIMANLAAEKDRFLVYQFASDLENVNWQSDHLLPEILRALHLHYQELANKTLILDGFDEIRIDGDRKRILDKLDQELKNRNALKNLSLLITCRENYIYDLQDIMCDYITLQPWDEGQIEIFCKAYWGKCGRAVLKDKVQKIQENKEIFGIPLILYMILALDASVENSSSVVDVYDQIFSLKKGGIYDRCYDTEHRTNEPKVKKYIHRITQRISFWIFENNAEAASIYQKNFRDICEKVRLEAEDDSEMIQSNTLIGSYFKIKHCEGIKADEVTFVHRSIYEYFVALYFYESVKSLTSKEEAAGKLGELLKKGLLSDQMLAFIRCKFDSMREYNLPVLTKDIFNIMLRDGMTYYTDTAAKDDSACRTDAAYKNIVEREMNIFANMLEVVHIWNPVLGVVDDAIVSFLQYNSQTALNLQGINLVQAFSIEDTTMFQAIYPEAIVGFNLCGANLQAADFTSSELIRVVFSEAALMWANFSFATLSEVLFLNANLYYADFSHAHLSSAEFSGANLQHADMANADLSWAILEDADLKDADLGGADLSNANLGGANLECAVLCLAKLEDANVSGANLTRADLHGAELDDADFSGANLRGALLDERQVAMLEGKCDLIQSRVWIPLPGGGVGNVISYLEYRDVGRSQK